MSDPVRYLRGVGPRKAALFERLGVRTAGDLLEYFPFRVDDFSRLVPMDEVRPGDEVTVRGRVLRTNFVGSQRGPAFRVDLSDGRGLIHLIWYNMPYMYQNFPIGATVLASGKVERRRNGLEIPHPVWRKATESESARGPIIPVYHSTAGLTSQAISKVVKEALPDYGPEVPALIPPSLLARHGCLSEGLALRYIHDPPSAEDWRTARKTLAFREMLCMQIALLAMKKETEQNPGPERFAEFGLAERFLTDLPFALTPAQRRAIEDIRGDLSSGKAMNRLLQGDVGSGKTVVAMYALLAGVANGFQGAFLAPTAILAEQHRATFIKFAQNLVRLGFLTGSVSNSERKKVLGALAAGELDVVVGTHALLEPEVRWRRLGVVVTDEQHRFGVRQRLRLAERGTVSPHVLVMSATPIPRSLALTLYGDLDISVIDEMPPGRKPPKTVVLDSRQREAAYAKVREEAAKGRQAYVVCPLIREGDAGRKSAEKVREELLRGPLRGLQVGLIHGDLPRREADEVMARFVAGKIQVLVSTTVIEVGIDVERATVMVVEDADYFGLATLHQLRGRVGRGDQQAYCFLLSSGTGGGRERLRIMETTSNGFRVAEADLEERGPGQFFGTEQHGLPDVKLGTLEFSLEMAGEARDEARRILESACSGSPDPEAVRLLSTVRERFGNLFSHARSR